MQPIFLVPKGMSTAASIVKFFAQVAPAMIEGHRTTIISHKVSELPLNGRWCCPTGSSPNVQGSGVHSNVSLQ